MTDTIFAPATNPPVATASGNTAVKPDPVKTEPKVVKVDHLVEIAELARSLHNVSPSGAETVSAKLLEHVGALQDPKAYDERMAKDKKAEDDLEAARAKDREANKVKPEVKKVA